MISGEKRSQEQKYLLKFRVSKIPACAGNIYLPVDNKYLTSNTSLSAHLSKLNYEYVYITMNNTP